MVVTDSVGPGPGLHYLQQFGSSTVQRATDVEVSDVVITMGCGDTCPYFPGVSYRDWKLEDPAEQPLDVVRGIRDDIAERVQALVDELLGR